MKLYWGPFEKFVFFFFFISGCSSELAVFLFKVITTIDAGKLLYGQQSTGSYGTPKSIAVKIMFAGSTETVVNVSYDFFLKNICISCQRRPEKKPLRLVKKYAKKTYKRMKTWYFSNLLKCRNATQGLQCLQMNKIQKSFSEKAAAKKLCNFFECFNLVGPSVGSYIATLLYGE